MAHGNVREFDPAKESMEDFQQRFEFYCLANNIKADDEAQITSKNPPKAPPHPWLVPQHPWQRIHVDHAQFKDRYC